MSAFYNEHDPFAAQWLRNLIDSGAIAPGVVDERDIRDIEPQELEQFVQCHFFAGIGIWSAALRWNGWPDDRPIWTGSCPCQPFSAAGRGEGLTDERHLWPHWHWLIDQCRPGVVAGEQVASKDGLGWLDLVSADMVGTGYTFGAIDLCAAGFGLEFERSQASAWLQRAIYDCPDPDVADALRDFADWARTHLVDGGHHIRQRLYFGAIDRSDDADWRLVDDWGCRRDQVDGGDAGAEEGARGSHGLELDRSGGAYRLVDLRGARLEGLAGDGADRDQSGRDGTHQAGSAATAGDAGRMADAEGELRRSGSRHQGPAGERGILTADDGGAFGLAYGSGREREGRTARAHDGLEGRESGRVQGTGVAQSRGSGDAQGLVDDVGERLGEGGDGHNGRHDGHEPDTADAADPGSRQQGSGDAAADSGAGGMADGGGERREVALLDEGRGSAPDGVGQAGVAGVSGASAGADAGARRWNSVDWLLCTDGKWRASEPESFPLAHASESRMGRLSAQGNALDQETANAFVGALMDALADLERDAQPVFRHDLLGLREG